MSAEDLKCVAVPETEHLPKFATLGMTVDTLG